MERQGPASGKKPVVSSLNVCLYIHTGLPAEEEMGIPHVDVVVTVSSQCDLVEMVRSETQIGSERRKKKNYFPTESRTVFLADSDSPNNPIF
jgi:hypothetical protein